MYDPGDDNWWYRNAGCFRMKTPADFVVCVGGGFLCWLLTSHPEWFSFLNTFQFK